MQCLKEITLSSEQSPIHKNHWSTLYDVSLFEDQGRPFIAKGTNSQIHQPYQLSPMLHLYALRTPPCIGNKQYISIVVILDGNSILLGFGGWILLRHNGITPIPIGT